MKYLLSILLFLFAGSLACKKNIESSILDGNWKLVQVTDRSTRLNITPVANAGATFNLRFEGYKFSGNTFRNNFSLGNFTLTNGNEIRFGTYVRSELNEETWGKAFFEVLSSCFIQSVTPCSPVYVELKQDSMIWTQHISTYELRFIRTN